MTIRCVAGLGNPGARYEWTRHNAGFWIADRLAAKASLAWRRRGGAEEAEGAIEGRDVVLLKPRTYMNESGSAVLECLQRHRLLPAEMIVVVDDVTLPPGRLRLRPSGSAGGHRGLTSVEEALGTREYPRLRIGVGGPPAGEDVADYVLRPLEREERILFDEIAARGCDAVCEVLARGLAPAMNRFNAAPGAETDSQATRSGETKGE